MFQTSVAGVSVLHDIDNMSDHEPIVLKLYIESTTLSHSESNRQPSISWPKAVYTDLINYSLNLSDALSQIQLPIESLICNDLHCSNMLMLLILFVFLLLMPVQLLLNSLYLSPVIKLHRVIH